MYQAYPDNSPPGQFPRTGFGPDELLYSVVVVLMGSCPQWGITPRDCGSRVGNGWALFLSGGELSLVGSCPRTAPSYVTSQCLPRIKVASRTVQKEEVWFSPKRGGGEKMTQERSKWATYLNTLTTLKHLFYILSLTCFGGQKFAGTPPCSVRGAPLCQSDCRERICWWCCPRSSPAEWNNVLTTSMTSQRDSFLIWFRNNNGSLYSAVLERDTTSKRFTVYLILSSVMGFNNNPALIVHHLNSLGSHSGQAPLQGRTHATSSDK